MHGVRKRILVIEDEGDIARLIRLHLDDLGFLVTIAFDGNTGLRKASTGSWDLIILDLRLPGIDGLEICRRLRQDSRSVPILMLTSKSSELDRVVGLEIGADDYVTKPFSPRELLARIRAVLRRLDDRRPEPTIIDIDGFEVDAGRRQVRMPDGSVVEPTAREFDLLFYLAENRGLALSRGQILEAVWGYDYFGETRTVDVHVRQLRKKLDGIPLETVWGVGYRIGS